jgi:hypothetical protein
MFTVGEPAAGRAQSPPVGVDGGGVGVGVGLAVSVGVGEAVAGSLGATVGGAVVSVAAGLGATDPVQAVPFSAKLVGIGLLEPFQVPLNPNDAVLLVPMRPFHAAFVAVTELPVWVIDAPHPWVTA